MRGPRRIVRADEPPWMVAWTVLVNGSDDGGLEALRVLKRRLSDVLYRAILADAHAATATVT